MDVAAGSGLASRGVVARAVQVSAGLVGTMAETDFPRNLLVDNARGLPGLQELQGNVASCQIRVEQHEPVSRTVAGLLRADGRE